MYLHETIQPFLKEAYAIMNEYIAPFKIPFDAITITYIDKKEYVKEFNKPAFLAFNEKDIEGIIADYNTFDVFGICQETTSQVKGESYPVLTHSIDIMYDFSNVSKKNLFKLLSTTIHEISHVIDDHFATRSKEEGMKLFDEAITNTSMYENYASFNELPDSVTSLFLSQQLFHKGVEYLISEFEFENTENIFRTEIGNGELSYEQKNQLSKVEYLKSQFYSTYVYSYSQNELEQDKIYNTRKEKEGWAQLFTEVILSKLIKDNALTSSMSASYQKKLLKNATTVEMLKDKSNIDANFQVYIDGYTMFKELGIDGALKKLNLVSGAFCPYIPPSE